METTNYCILTGIFVEKNKNADNADIKRPVIDMEIVCINEHGDISFENVPVLLSDIVLSKTGFSVGEILTISGEVRSDKGFGIYIEAETLTKLKSEKMRSIVSAKAELLQMSQRFNFVSVTGIVKSDSEITVKRSSYSRGSLKTADDIPVIFPTEKKVTVGKPVTLFGLLGFRGDNFKLSICANGIHNLADEEASVL